jgi:hypothetical protein
MANAALNRVLTRFGSFEYQGKENFKLYVLHPVNFFLSVMYIRILSVITVKIRYNGRKLVITDGKKK